MSLRSSRRPDAELATAVQPAGDRVPVPVMSAGLDGTIRSWNRAAVAMLGWNESDVVGRPLADVLGREFLASSDPNPAPQRHHLRIAHARGGFVDADVVVETHGEWGSESGRTVVVVLPAAVEPVHLGAASTPRVRSWSEAAAATKALGGDAVCCLVTVLGLKAVNVGYSRSIGDAVLRGVGERLEAFVEPDGACVRVDGDRFALVLHADRWTMHHERRLLAALRDPIGTSLGSVRVSGCVGLSMGPSNSPLVLLDAAEVSLNAALRQGAGSIVTMASPIDAHDRQAARIGSALLDAMAERAISPHFQPVLDLATGDIVMVEALARWRTDELGDVNPALLISVAEDAGLIHQLGLHILACALDLLADEAHAASPLRAVSVNVSPKQLEHPDFVREVIDAIDARRIDGSRLVLELTESQVIDDPALCATRLSLLRDRGIRIAIDDFGTGRANLAYLTQIPVDIMKIDRRFVAPLGSTQVDESLVRSMIGLAHDLGLEVIAEGVETPLQHATLRRLGCRYAQGFLYSAARPPADATRPVPMPGNEPGSGTAAEDVRRVAAVRSLTVTADPVLDELVQRAATTCRTAAAAISLVDEDRQVFIASVGLDVDTTERTGWFCRRTADGATLFEVADTGADDSEGHVDVTVGGAPVRSVAGVALRTWDGFHLGTLCVFDVEPHELEAQQRRALVDLADTTARSLDARRTESELRTARVEVQRMAQQADMLRRRSAALLDAFVDGLLVVDGEMRITEANLAAARTFDWVRDDCVGRSLLEAIEPDDRLAMTAWFRRASEERGSPQVFTAHPIQGGIARLTARDARAVDGVDGIVVTISR